MTDAANQIEFDPIFYSSRLHYSRCIRKSSTVLGMKAALVQATSRRPTYRTSGRFSHVYLTLLLKEICVDTACTEQFESRKQIDLILLS
jgi:hypothetical protein